MKPINIKFIPQNQQRYETVGDYWETDNSIEIRITEFSGNPMYSHMILIHELVEKVLCTYQGVKDQEIDKFDMNFKSDDEPGDANDSPYRNQHCFATAVERMICAALNLSWHQYDKAVNDLFGE